MTVPRHLVPRRPPSWDPADPGAWDWDEIPALPPFQLADGSGAALQQTRARLCWDELALHTRFDCADRDAWGTYRRRNDPVYEEEAVEVFLAPGEEDPKRYFELEVSPLGTLFDATIHNPTSRRTEMRGDPSLGLPRAALGGGAGRVPSGLVGLAVDPVARSSAVGAPRVWRANLYRIERPRGWRGRIQRLVADLTSPADFHKPARFGLLELGRTHERDQLYAAAASRAVWALFAVGLLIALGMLARGQVAGDQLDLLARGWLLAARGSGSPTATRCPRGGRRRAPSPACWWRCRSPLAGPPGGERPGAALPRPRLPAARTPRSSASSPPSSGCSSRCSTG